MPLTRQAFHNTGEHIHIALWPKVHEMHQVASRHYAFEGRCFVVAVGQLLHKDQLPSELSISEEANMPDDGMILNGNSCIIGPDGKYLLPPQENGPDLIIHTINDLKRTIDERMLVASEEATSGSVAAKQE